MHQEASISINGIQLYTQSWTVEKAKANVILIHGLAEHSSRYAWTASKLNAAGINVYAFDQRGHGKSEGLKGFIGEMSDLVSDFKQFIEQLELDPELPKFIYAHSMGALVTSLYVLDHQPAEFRGILFSGGALKVDPDLSPILQKLSPIVGRLAPKLKTVKIDSSLVSQVKEEAEAYAKDPLVYHGGTYASTGFQMLRSIKYVQSKFHKWSIPVLIMHGDADKLIDPAGSEKMFDQIAAVDKELILWEGQYHEIMREPMKEEVLDKMTSWILERL